MTLSRRTVLISGGAALLFGVGGYTLFQSAWGRADTARVMNPPQAHIAASQGQILLVDIRRPDEWRATGVPEHGVPIDMRDADFIARLQAERAAPDQPIAVICARGVRSARLTLRLAAAGIGPLIDIPEGMLGGPAGRGWLARGLPITPYPAT